MTRRTVKPLRLSLGEASTPAAEEKSAARSSTARRPSKLRHGVDIAASAGGSLRTADTQVDLRRLRGVVRASLGKNLFDNAIFFANKLVTLSGGLARDVYLLAQAYFLGKQYRRAVYLIQEHGFLSTQENMPVLKGPDGRRSTRSSHPQQDPNANRPLSSRSGQPRFSFEGKPGQAPQTPSRRRNVIDENIEFVLLAVQCLVESAQHEEAQSVLEVVLAEADADALRARARNVPRSFNSPTNDQSTLGGRAADGDVNPIAALCLLRGRVYETLDNRPRAATWYRLALVCDIFCYEAFDALIDNQLRPSEERQLMAELQRLGSFEGDAAWLREVYSSRLSKHDYGQRVEDRFEALDHICAAPEDSADQAGADGDHSMVGGTQNRFIDPAVHNLGNDLDCAADKAECLYQQHDAQGAYQVTRAIRQQDPYHLRCITVHLAALVELQRKSELFHTAHSLVDSYPSHAVSWFAVGCYYYCISKFDAARRFFHKATTMDPSMAVAWLGFGHSFAAQDESDQAMAAYRTASRLFIGSHLPVLCTAIEYLRTNNVTLAEQFCRQAKAMCTTDPLVLNELGVVHYRQHRFQIAVDCFQEALKLCRHQPERLRYAWEPAMFNLAHANRKLGRYEEAITYYELALSYSPKEASTYSALGLTYHLLGRIEEAIQNYHNALGLKPEDTFASEMLDKALAESYTKLLEEDPLPAPPRAVGGARSSAARRNPLALS